MNGSDNESKCGRRGLIVEQTNVSWTTVSACLRFVRGSGLHIVTFLSPRALGASTLNDANQNDHDCDD
jgi:hypothetical protein